MSPEQARGRKVDKRTDIWALGCILFEILTGTRACRGESTTDVLADVLKGEPAWNLLPDDTPVEISQLIRRSLVKSPRDRLHDVADARLMIDDAMAQLSSPAYRTPDEDAPSRTRRRFGLLSLTVISALALVVGVLGGRPHGTVGRTGTRKLLHRASRRPSPSVWIIASRSRCHRMELRSSSSASTAPVGDSTAGSSDSFEVEPIPGTENAMGPRVLPGRTLDRVHRPGRETNQKDRRGRRRRHPDRRGDG